MTLETAVRIGARRNGADIERVDIVGLVSLAERTARAFQALTGAPIETTRDLVRFEIMSGGRHPSHFEAPINEHSWFESFWSTVKYPQCADINRRSALQLLPGGAVPCKRRRRLPKLTLVQGGRNAPVS